MLRRMTKRTATCYHVVFWTFCASFWLLEVSVCFALEPEYVLREGGAIASGEIIEVTPVETSERFETGIIQFHIMEVIAGSLPTETITIQYARYANPRHMDAWVLTKPSVGLQLLVFVKGKEKGRFEAVGVGPLDQTAKEAIEEYKQIGRLEAIQDRDAKFLGLQDASNTKGRPIIQQYALREMCRLGTREAVYSRVLDILINPKIEERVRYTATFLLKTTIFQGRLVDDPINNQVIAGFVKVLRERGASVRIKLAILESLKLWVVRQNVENKEILINRTIPTALDDVLREEKDPKVVKLAREAKGRLEDTIAGILRESRKGQSNPQ